MFMYDSKCRTQTPNCTVLSQRVSVPKKLFEVAGELHYRYELHTKEDIKQETNVSVNIDGFTRVLSFNANYIAKLSMLTSSTNLNPRG